MSKKYVCELLRKVDLEELDLIREMYLESDYLEEEYSEDQLSEFIEFLETRIDDDADNNKKTIKLLTDAIASFKALKRINKALHKLHKVSGYSPDLGDEFADEIIYPAIKKILKVVKLKGI